MVLWGQGDVHLQIALDRLRNRQNLAVVGQPATVPYRETIKRGAEQHSRFKRQSGGHGQFADCTIEVKPLPRGSGFTFKDSVVGGAIPRNYIPAVEEGVVEALQPRAARLPGRRPRRSILITGQFHAVDSSDMAFKTGRPPGDPGSLAEMRAVPAWSRSTRSRSRCRTPSPRASSGWCPVAAANCLAMTRKEDWPGWDVVQGLSAAQRVARSDRRVALADPRASAASRINSTTCRS